MHYLAWRTASQSSAVFQVQLAVCEQFMLPFYGQSCCWGAAAQPGHTFPALHPNASRVLIKPSAWFSACFLSPLLAAYLCVWNTAESLPAWESEWWLEENHGPHPGSQRAITWMRNKPLWCEALSLESICSSSNISIVPFSSSWVPLPVFWGKITANPANYLKAMGRWRFSSHDAVKRTGRLGIEMSLRKPLYLKQNWTERWGNLACQWELADAAILLSPTQLLLEKVWILFRGVLKTQKW